MGVKEALYEFKEDIIKEFDFKKANQKNDNLNDNDNNNLNNNVNDNGSDNK